MSVLTSLACTALFVPAAMQLTVTQQAFGPSAIADVAVSHDALAEPAGAWRLQNPARGVDVVCSPRGVAVTVEEGLGVELTLEAWGRRGALRAVGEASSCARFGPRVELEREGLVEWFVNDERGIEHGFTIDTAPEGDRARSGAPLEPLEIVLAVTGDLVPEVLPGGRSAAFADAFGERRLSYRNLVAIDAKGVELEVCMEALGGSLVLVVEDAGATYPLVVDPLFGFEIAYGAGCTTSAFDNFGQAVATDLNTFVVGAPSFGSAHVFSRNPLGFDNGGCDIVLGGGASNSSGFGWSVAIDGDTIVSGAPFAETMSSPTDVGSAHIYDRSGTTWTSPFPLGRLMASDGEAFDSFGAGVAVSGDTVVIGAPFDDDAGLDTGSAYVFVRSGTTWIEQAKLIGSDLGTFLTFSSDEFGQSVAIDGDTIVVGAHGQDLTSSGLSEGHGAAYVFTRSGTVWTEQQKLVASDALTNCGDLIRFGYPVRIDGDTIAVGAEGRARTDCNATPGGVYVFTRSGSVWSEEAIVTASDGGTSDSFGQAVDIDGDVLVVGAYRDNVLANDSGSAYFYRRDGTTWTDEVKVWHLNGQAFDNMGVDVALDGTIGVVGVFQDDTTATDTGAIIMYRVLEDVGCAYPSMPWLCSTPFCDAEDGALSSCPCSNPGDPYSGCEIQQGTGGVELEVLAQQTSPLNRATVTGSGFPAASTPTSIVIRSAGLDPAAPVVFGDGLRCVGVPLVRLGATFAGAGTSTHTFGHGAMAGTGTFYYQLWFRNTPIMFCDPTAAFNLSSGRTLVWL